MKKVFNILAFLFVSCISYAQTLTNTENYVYTRSYLEAVTTESTTAKQVEAVQYYDGLGRVKQSIGIKSTVNGKDLVIANAYDLRGRQTKSYLPVPTNTLSGAYQTVVDSTSANTYYQVSNAYSEVLLEKSPLGRVLKQAHPGADWAISTNNTVKFDYQTNIANEVKRLKATATWNATTKINDITIAFAPNDNYTTNGFYNANTLSKKIVKDEDDKETQIFTNSIGQTILLRKVNKTDAGTTQYLDTYYVYDDFGNLVLVIPPKAATFVTITDLNNAKDKLCYQYKYDKYNRVVEKKLPGKKYWEYVIYDKQGRPILSQDSNQHLKEWSFVKYDQFDRIVYTGIYTLANTTREALQAIIDGTTVNPLNNETRATTALVLNGQNIYYTNTAFPTTTASMQVMQVHYYDDYPTGSIAKPATILTKNTLNATATAITSNGITSSRSTKGLSTVSFIKNVDANSWTSAYIWYDTLGRVIGTHSVNYLGGYTKTERSLDFVGATLEQYTYHKRIATSTEIKVKDRFVYNTKNILLQHYQQILNNGSGSVIAEELLADYTYNDLGQVTNKKVGNNLQTIDYTYNIRGWLTSINDVNNLGTDLFAYKIKYNQLEGAANPNNEYSNQTVKKNYNGNITEIDWKTAGAQSDGKKRRYGFVYDNVNRLRAGFYQDPNNAYSKEYSEYIEYDINGNITKLNRTGKIQTTSPEVMDDLTYNYAGNDNVLTSLTESSKGNAGSGYKLAANTTGATWGYDDNGNNITNLDTGITNIAYNFLNLPTAITTNNSQNVSYTYRADGTKLKKVVVATSKTTDYLDGFQYENAIVQFLPNEEGYYDFKNAKYVYNYKDHLGNVRITFTKNTSGAAVVLEENNYYPFGLRHQGYNTGNTANNTYAYKYNGKELQENGLADYGWRNYLPELGRWNVIDQLAEKYNSTSPYAYVLNNSIKNIDPNGMYTSNSDYIKELSEDAPSGGATTFTFSNGLYSPYTTTFAPMSSNQVQALYNFLNSGGTGSYTYWTGDTIPINRYTYEQGDQYKNIQGLVGHTITIGNNQPQLSISHYNFGGYNESGGSNFFGDVDWTRFSKGIGGFAFGNDVKTQIMEFAIRNSFKSAKSGWAFNSLKATQQEWRIAYVLGKGGAKYLKVAKGLGTLASVITTTYSASQVVDQYQKGGVNEVLNHRDIVDTGVGVVGLGSTALVSLGLISNPVGWAIGAGVLVYGVGTLIYDSYTEP